MKYISTGVEWSGVCLTLQNLRDIVLLSKYTPGETQVFWSVKKGDRPYDSDSLSLRLTLNDVRD